ncbi:hypothetical protein TWF694_008348 [Orbilia ellipsospora]|uniref:Uncharacterized protein n=1 Tax=Orbilia ellipsospora TaxID=2528407 RepID=A0AAV9XJ89_9PEZI
MAAPHFGPIPNIAPHTIGPFPVAANHNQTVGPQPMCPTQGVGLPNPPIGRQPPTPAQIAANPALVANVLNARQHNNAANQVVHNNNRMRGPWGGGNAGCSSSRFLSPLNINTGSRPQIAHSTAQTYRCHVVVAYPQSRPDNWWRQLLVLYNQLTPAQATAATRLQLLVTYTTFAGIYTDPNNAWP